LLNDEMARKLRSNNEISEISATTRVESYKKLSFITVSFLSHYASNVSDGSFNSLA